MRRVLWIDDEPSRFSLVDWPEDVEVTFALGFKQISYYLNQSKIKWELILLDHDMGLHENEMEVCERFFEYHHQNPILCVSNNTHRRQAMHLWLLEHEVDSEDLPVTLSCFSDRVLRKLELTNE